MKNLSRGTWIAIAAIAAVPATVAIAKTVDGGGGWRSMTPETRARLEDGRIAMVKTALQLTPDQEKLWAPVETQVRDAFKTREARIEEWKKKREERKAAKEDAGGEKSAESKRGDLAARFEKLSQRMGERADRMKAFSTAFSPFYASLSDEQKDVLRPLMKQLSPNMGHRGHRFAEGWGPGGRHHGGWFGHGQDGPKGHGPQMQDNDDNDGGPNQGPGEPDKKG